MKYSRILSYSLLCSFQTIFEIGSTSKSRTQEIMKSKRRKHETVIEKAKQQTNRKQNEEAVSEKIDENKLEETTQEEIKVR